MRTTVIKVAHGRDLVAVREDGLAQSTEFFGQLCITMGLGKQSISVRADRQHASVGVDYETQHQANVDEKADKNSLVFIEHQWGQQGGSRKQVHCRPVGFDFSK